jgi:hypothetical protein
MRWRSSPGVRPASGFIEPCIPSKAVGPDWAFEIKHDGYRLMVRKDDEGVRVYTRRGADWTERYPRVVAAVRSLKVRSVILDGEGIVYDHKGLASIWCIPANTTKRYPWLRSICSNWMVLTFESKSCSIVRPGSRSYFQK